MVLDNRRRTSGVGHLTLNGIVYAASVLIGGDNSDAITPTAAQLTAI